MPAKEARAESSMGAEERTAKGRRLQSCRSSSFASSASIAAGKGSPDKWLTLAEAPMTKPSGTGTPSWARRPSCQPLPPAWVDPASAAALQSRMGAGILAFGRRYGKAVEKQIQHSIQFTTQVPIRQGQPTHHGTQVKELEHVCQLRKRIVGT